MIGRSTGPDSSDAPRPAAHRPWRWIPWILGVASLAAVIAAALHFAEAEEFARIAEQAEPWWLALAVVLQAGTYVAAGQVFRGVVRAGDHFLSVPTACRLGLTKLFVDQALPSAGLSGTVVLANGLEQHGIPRSVVAAGVVVDLASYYAAYGVALGAALTITAARGEASTILLVVSLVFLAFGVALSVVVLALAGGKKAHVLPRRLAAWKPLRNAIDFIERADPQLARSPRLLVQGSLYQLAIFLCDATTVWVLIRALGPHGSASGVFASFMISSLLRTVELLPGGLGAFEAASVVTLRMVGVPTAVALAATLLFRGLSFWLPMIPGLLFSRRVMSR